MANYFEISQFKTKDKISGSSRYSRSKIGYYSEEGKLTLTIYKRTPFQFSHEDKWFEITDEYEYRPDKVSFDYYGSVDFWWKIMETNNMKDILEFKSGKNIRLPSSSLR